VATILSAQCTDERVNQVTPALFERYPNAAALHQATTAELEPQIVSTGFFRQKSKALIGMAQKLVAEHGGEVPGDMEKLVTLPGVGRKTANLVMILAYQSQQNICVDTHVHRISNRLGWVRTRTPEETEHALYKTIQKRWWPLINLYLVTWGQNTCRPVYPRCDECAIRRDCQFPLR
jgi:endonuclease-3